MTKEEILQKVNDYCNEKSYTEETLTSDFKNQFAENFIKGREEGDIKDEKTIADIEFSLRTAFSASSKGITFKSNSFSEKENNYKKQIEELKKQVEQSGKKEQEKEEDIPEKYKEQIKELENFKKNEELKKKREAISSLAKKDIREQYHSSFDKFFEKMEITTEGTEKEQAEKAQKDFHEMVKDMIGDIHPFIPRNENIEERTKKALESVEKIII